jgi:hypothetical protein
MKVPLLFRAIEWWKPKIVQLLVVGDMTIVHFDGNLMAII